MAYFHHQIYVSFIFVNFKNTRNIRLLNIIVWILIALWKPRTIISISMLLWDAIFIRCRNFLPFHNKKLTCVFEKLAYITQGRYILIPLTAKLLFTIQCSSFKLNFAVLFSYSCLILEISIFSQVKFKVSRSERFSHIDSYNG